MYEAGELRSIPDLLSFLEFSGIETHWFRGESRAFPKPLIPLVFRSPAYATREIPISRSFQLEASSRIVQPPDLEDYAKWLVIARHHGLPTRLLDWSESPLAAMYFAVAQHQDVDGVLWMLDAEELNSRHLGNRHMQSPLHAETRELIKGAYYERVAGERVLAVQPQSVDMRMRLQQARFTVHDCDVPLLASKGHANRYLWRFTIPASAKAGLQRHLAMIGVGYSTLFPDLSALAADIAAAHEERYQVYDTASPFV